MTKQEIIAKINKFILGQGNQVDLGSVLPSILLDIIGLGSDTDERLGDLASLDTDHKSNIVSAINELADLAETTHFVISFDKTSAELKAVYDACAENIVLAKNIVFYNATDELYYRVNGYNMVSDVLKLHTIMQGDSGLVDTVINLSSNGTLSVG